MVSEEISPIVRSTLLYAANADQLVTQADYRAAADTSAADMGDVIAVYTDDGRACAHADDDDIIKAGQMAAAEADGRYLVDLAGRYAVHVLCEKGRADPGHHDAL